MPWPASRDPNIADSAAAVHRALVVRNSLLVAGPKPTLRTGEARRRACAPDVRLDRLERILIVERLLLAEAQQLIIGCAGDPAICSQSEIQRAHAAARSKGLPA